MPASSSKHFWWVNQNQTFEHEFRGGYLWSPKRNANMARNQFYENMRMVAPGDVIFSFRDATIAAIGVAQSYGYESPKPREFGGAGAYWGNIGWRVDVNYVPLIRNIEPRQHMDVLRPLLPKRYSPLQANGNGNQGVYLAELSRAFAQVLAGLVGSEAQAVVTMPVGRDLVTSTETMGIEEWEGHLQDGLKADKTIPETEKTALIKARRGQGIFKQKVMQVEKACRITKVENLAHLIGSHIKPWRDANNAERLNGENGLLLTPSIDRLFDRGFISFEGNGELLISPRADVISLGRMGVSEGTNVGAFTRIQQGFLEFHRDEVFLNARRG
jgi:hypothetical protein